MNKTDEELREEFPFVDDANYKKGQYSALERLILEGELTIGDVTIPKCTTQERLHVEDEND